MNANQPLHLSASFDAAMAAIGSFDPSAPLAVAVSGGADSMALLLLAQAWAKAHQASLTALTVDHALRSESANEARQLQGWCNSLGITHHILVWNPPHLTSAIQENARNARYELLTQWCEAHSVRHLLTAHHRDDQAETLFFRLARGSGLDGLACMQPVKQLGEIRLLRPLLAFPKKDLVELLQSAGQPWIEDPSNRNPDYTRVRIREALMACPDYDVMSQRAYALSQSFSYFRRAIEQKTEQKISELVRFPEDTHAVIDAAAFAALEPEYGLRILGTIIRRLGTYYHKPRSEKLARLYAEITENRISHPRELGGCIFHPVAHGRMNVHKKL